MKYNILKFKDFEYKVNKLLFISGFIIILLLSIYTLSLSNFSGKTYYYTKCEFDTCINQFYYSNLCLYGELEPDSRYCTQKIMTKGEVIGEYPPYMVRNFDIIGVSIVLIIILLNTLLYNKEFFKYLKHKFKEEND